MGLLDKVKRAVRGPVTIDITAPETFRWTDESLTVTAILANETDDPLVVAEVRFSLEIIHSGNDKGARSKLGRTVSGPFGLDPGTTTERTAELPLSLDISKSMMEGAAVEAGLPDWVGGAMKSMSGEVPHRLGRHRVSVVVKLDDSSRLSSSSTTTTAV